MESGEKALRYMCESRANEGSGYVWWGKYADRLAIWGIVYHFVRDYIFLSGNKQNLLGTETNLSH